MVCRTSIIHPKPYWKGNDSQNFHRQRSECHGSFPVWRRRSVDHLDCPPQIIRRQAQLKQIVLGWMMTKNSDIPWTKPDVTLILHNQIYPSKWLFHDGLYWAQSFEEDCLSIAIGMTVISTYPIPMSITTSTETQQNTFGPADHLTNESLIVIHHSSLGF